MIRSMTGFGDAANEKDGTHYAVELRSLNNKYFKASIRLPEQLAGLEAELETHLRNQVNRGSFTFTIKLRLSDAKAASRVNDAALLTYVDHLKTIKDQIKDNDSVHIDLTQLLALPGVLQPAEDEETLMAKSRPILIDLLDQVVIKMNQMRDAEGKALAEDLLKHRDFILERIEIIKTRASLVIDEYHDRLKTRIDQLMARAELNIGEQDLIKEIAVYADRSDISEEISRTTGHLEQLEQIIGRKDEEPVGRTLDFLAQELLREANTIASKSNDADISRAIVEVKSAIDRIKEQVQNVE
ncbi:YicC/YloC family endoribonuclease [Poriferisphaera sp. WC338]|uniref:YicC/YloC family endoribonuclease n=1 Tax=Poriferisphaera sp. WC338 TaxID=3425129 RepID=UPI003D81BA55